MICPKCQSTDILVGNARKPNHCSECHHNWGKGKKKSKLKSEMLGRLIFKSPDVLMTFNQDLRQKSRIVRRIDTSLM